LYLVLTCAHELVLALDHGGNEPVHALVVHLLSQLGSVVYSYLLLKMLRALRYALACFQAQSGARIGSTGLRHLNLLLLQKLLLLQELKVLLLQLGIHLRQARAPCCQNSLQVVLTQSTSIEDQLRLVRNERILLLLLVVAYHLSVLLLLLLHEE
jgi:hypothetical protein